LTIEKNVAVLLLKEVQFSAILLTGIWKVYRIFIFHSILMQFFVCKILILISYLWINKEDFIFDLGEVAKTDKNSKISHKGHVMYCHHFVPVICKLFTF